MENFNLEGKIAIVTGASRGIGESIANVYAKLGAKLILVSRKKENLDLVANKINSKGGNAKSIAANIGNIDEIEKVVDLANEIYGGIDIIVNNAGTNPHFGPILTSEEKHWSKTLDVNLMGAFNLVKASLKIMKSRGGGKVINIASVAGDKPLPSMGVYCVSKAALIMLTKVLAVELSSFNIQVNSVSPGFVKTDFSKALWDNPKLYDIAIQAIPQNRIATPDELMGIITYLASEASNFTTGSDFVVDGGQLLGGITF